MRRLKLLILLVSCVCLLGMAGWLCYSGSSQIQDMPVERLLQNLKSKSFSGKPIDLNLEEEDLKTLFVYFERFSGIPFELSPDIQTEPMMRWTYKCKQVPWDQVLSFIIQEFNLEAAQKGEKVYLQPRTDSRMKIIREDNLKKTGPLKGFPLLIIIAVLAAAGGTAGFLFFKRRSKTKTSTSSDFSIDPEKAEKIKIKVIYLFDVEKIFKNDDITLRSLSENLSIPPHQLSWILNNKMNITFSQLVNSYRVDEVKKRLASPEDADKTILDIAFDTGFSTKTAFNRTFLRLTGKTPSQYRKQNLPKKSA